jgi:predicted aspartyl protease
MDAFRVSIEIGDKEGRRFEHLDALVDTGSTYTWIPKSILYRLGLKPERDRLFEFTDGRQQSYGIGWSSIRLDGIAQPTLVVFGDDDTEPVLGVVTLEEYGLSVDVVRHQLLPTPGLLKGYHAT